MFDIGDYIVYGNNGICQIEDITHPDVAGADQSRLYYVLIPEKTKESRLFCPADNCRVVLRKIITAEEAQAIMQEVKSLEPLEILNERQRDECYKNTIKSCDLRQDVKMIKTLLARKKEREEIGKKITATDERYLKQAQECLFSELAIATGKAKEDIRDYVLEQCGA